MKWKILIILLILEIFIICLFVNSRIDNNYNIFQYMKNNINQLYLQDNPMPYDYPDKYTNYIQSRNYVSDYVDENNAITNILFTTKQNFSPSNFAGLTNINKCFQIKQTTTFNNQEITILIESTDIDKSIPMHIDNNYLLDDRSYQFYVEIQFSDYNISVSEKFQLYNLWFNNFKKLILDPVYKKSIIFKENNWGTFAPRAFYNQKFKLDENKFNDPILNYIDIYTRSNYQFPIILKIIGDSKSVLDDFNSDNTRFVGSLDKLNNYI